MAESHGVDLGLFANSDPTPSITLAEIPVGNGCRGVDACDRVETHRVGAVWSAWERLVLGDVRLGCKSTSPLLTLCMSMSESDVPHARWMFGVVRREWV